MNKQNITINEKVSGTYASGFLGVVTFSGVVEDVPINEEDSFWTIRNTSNTLICFHYSKLQNIQRG